MAKNYDDSDGRWVTINGRRVFIAEGQSLGDAMKKSGKFGNVKKVKGTRKNTYKDELTQKDKNEFAMGYGLSKDAVKGYAKARQDERDAKKDYKVKYDSVTDRYDKDKNFRDTLKKEHDKTLDATRKEVQSYLQDKEYFEKNGVESIDDLYKQINDNYYNVDRKDFDKIVKEESSKETTKSDRQQEYKSAVDDLYSDDPNRFKDITKAHDERVARENEASAKREKEALEKMGKEYKPTVPVDKDEKVEVPGFKDYEYNKKTGEVKVKDYDKKLKEQLSKEKSSDWQSQIEKNNAQMEKDVADIQNKINEYRTRSANAKDGLESYQLLKEADKLQNQYYERFRETERANAKIKHDANINPNDKYVNVDAYATYKDKFNDAFGEDGSKDNYVSAKMYTNDEFMEHLTDSNWHSERKALENANLTNAELEYIKDHTKVGAWSVGEELTGKANVEKMIQEAKSKASSKSMNESIREKASKTKADSNIDKGWDESPKKATKVENDAYKNYVNKVKEESRGNKHESGVIQRAYARMNEEQRKNTYDARLKQVGKDLDDKRAYYTKDRMNDIVNKSKASKEEKDAIKKNIREWQPAKNDQEIRNRYSEDIAYTKGISPNQTDSRIMNNYKRVELNRINKMLGGFSNHDFRNNKNVGDARNISEDKKSTSKIFNDAVRQRKAYSEYMKFKRLHPNTKKTLDDFLK